MDKTFIIGTAGHIDHGKTVLVKALTGIDTDRLPEEKERGISIDLGFAHFVLPDGSKTGIVDVPGHENFIRNMMAGSTGVDLALVVVAADDSVMPQTKEHLAILEFLGVTDAIFTITKIDLVDEEMVELVIQDIRELVKGRPFEDSPIVPVSAITGAGMERLKEELADATSRIKTKDRSRPPRIPIDRSFTIKGAGTVVTGTLWSGTIKAGDRLEVLPHGIEVRVRSLQVHGKTRDEAYAGERVAINIPGIPKEMLSRGDVLAAPGLLKPTYMLDARVKILPDWQKPIKRGTRLRFHHGTREILGRIYPIESDEIKPGENLPVQLRLENNAACLSGDRFVLRSYSPVTTIGGGIIIDPHPPKHKSKDPKALDTFHKLEKRNPADVVLISLNRIGKPSTIPQITRESGFPAKLIAEGMEKCLKEGEVIILKSKGSASTPQERALKHPGSNMNTISPATLFISRGTLDSVIERATKTLEEYHKQKPISGGMPLETFRKKVFVGEKPSVCDALTELLVRKNIVEISGNLARKPGFSTGLESKDKELLDTICSEISQAMFSPPDIKEISEKTGFQKSHIIDLLDEAVRERKLVKVSHEIYFSSEAVQMAISVLKNAAGDKGITVSEFRKLLGTTRKYALPLLDYMDREKITVRIGDARKLR